MSFSPVVSTLLKSAAPTVLTALALPPPFNIIASAVVSGVLAKYLPEGEQPAQPQTNGSAALSPGQVVEIIEKHSGDPSFLIELRKAELDLQKYEMDNNLRFAELEVKDRQGARDMAIVAGVSPSVFRLGKQLLMADGVASLVLVGGGVVLASGMFGAVDASLANAVFASAGIVVGRISARADQVANYYFGSSAGSADKSNQLQQTVATLGEAAARSAAARAPRPEEAARPALATIPAATPVDAVLSGPAAAARPSVAQVADPLGVLRTIVPEMMKPHHKFDGSVVWRLTPTGIAVGDAPPERTPGPPATVRRIWANFASAIRGAAVQYGVPCELLVACAAAESEGNPRAYRKEPDGRESAGLMQTLTSTATEMLARKITVQELFDPATSLAAGAAYIAHQRPQTWFDPVLVAAAYNAGSVRQANYSGNRWRLWCWKPEDGAHIDRFVQWFNDAMACSAEDGWGADGTPSFVTAIAEFAANPPQP